MNKLLEKLNKFNTIELSYKKWITLTLQHVLAFARDVLNIKLNTCILISFSLGEIPTLEIASQLVHSNFMGIILLHPIFADLNLTIKNVSNRKKNAIIKEGELYKVDTRLSKIECYVMVVQGKQDKTVDYTITSEKCKNIKKCIQYYPSSANRETLFIVNRMKVLKRIEAFMQMLSGNESETMLQGELNVTKNETFDNSNMSSLWFCFGGTKKMMTSFDEGEPDNTKLQVNDGIEEDAEYLDEEKNIMM